MPTWSIAAPVSSGVRSIGTPSASRTSALPHLEEIERLPCLATETPAAAATKAAAVDRLRLPEPSPPVPAVHKVGRLAVGGTIAPSRKALAAPTSSSTDSPLTRIAIRSPAICGSGHVWSTKLAIAAAISWRSRSSRRATFSNSSSIIVVPACRNKKPTKPGLVGGSSWRSGIERLAAGLAHGETPPPGPSLTVGRRGGERVQHGPDGSGRSARLSTGRPPPPGRHDHRRGGGRPPPP